MGGQVDIDAPGQGVSDHQRWRTNVIGPHQFVDAAREVSVARQHRRRHQLSGLDLLDDVGRQRARLAAAAGAAEPDQVKTQLLQRAQQPGVVQVAHHRRRSRRQRSLDPGRWPQAALHSIARHQSGGNHHLRVGRVGAGGDGGDHHRTFGQSPGFRVLATGVGAKPTLGEWRCQPPTEIRGDRIQGQAVLWPMRAGHAGAGLAHVNLDHAAVARWDICSVAEQAVGAAIGGHQRHQRFRPTRHTQVIQHLLVDGEVTAGGPVFGRHIGQCRPFRHRHGLRGRAEKFNRTVGNLRQAQALRHQQHQVGRPDQRCRHAGEPYAHHLGQGKGVGMAQQGSFGINATHAPAQHAQTIDHGRVRVTPNHKVGEGPLNPLVGGAGHDGGDALQIDLVNDAAAWRENAQAAKRLLRPAEKGIAFGVAFKLTAHVDRHGVGTAPGIDLQRVIHHQIDREPGVHPRRVAPRARQSVAQGGQVLQHRHTRRIRQDHARHIQRQIHPDMVAPVQHTGDVGWLDSAPQRL